MANKRIIDCIGAGESDVVRPSLWLKAAAPQLVDTWEWGPEEDTDVVLLDARNPVGAAALQRCRKDGVFFAQLIDADAPQPDAVHLRRPVQLEALVALLNEGLNNAIAPLDLIIRGDDFFEINMNVPIDMSDVPTVEFASRVVEPDREPLADKPQFLIPEKLGPGAVGPSPALLAQGSADPVIAGVLLRPSRHGRLG
jgi:hypothetical protein